MSLPDRDENANTSPAVEFLKALFGNTEQSIFLQTLANDAADQDEASNKRHLISRDIAAIERFVAKHDRNRRGMFVCVGTVNPGARQRSKDVIAESVGLHTDVDFKSIAETEAEAWYMIGCLEAKPTVVVRSGGGAHLYWLFKEPVDAQEHRQRLEVALKALAEVVAGDTAVCEISRLMRLPGSHNSKYGDLREVVVEWSDGPRYELEGLEEWLEYQRPLLTRKEVAKVVTAAVPDNPYLALAAQFGYRPRLDVDAALAEMAQGNIHDTLLRVSASLISSGREVEEVVSILMEASNRVAEPNWDWRVQEREIREMCAGAVKKFPPKPQPVEGVSRETDPPPDRATDTVKSTVDLSQERAKRAPPRLVKGGKINHLDIGELFLAGMRASGNLLMFTETQGAWLYQDGLWRLQDDRTLRNYLDRAIEQCILGTPVKSKLALVNETRAWLMRHDDLYAGEVVFDGHGQVPTKSGLVHPVTGAVSPAAPAHFCTWRIEAHYNPDALCLWWLTMLEDAFADRPDDVRAEYINLIQEVLGAGLIDAKPRGLSKAFIVQGGSNAGKSGLLEVMSGLFGLSQNTAALDTIDGTHGLVTFIKRVPWVLHEAFDQRKWHFSSTVKAIITGEPIQINIKNGPIFSQRVTVPIFWGTNNPPQFQEASKAIVNRIVVVKCKQEFDEGRPIGAAAQALKLGYGRPSELVLALEMAGLLAWAVVGLQRALSRGFFLQPAEALDAAHEIRLDSNLVAGFVEDCVAFDPDMRVSTPDFCAAFSAWWVEHKGENRGMPSNDSIGRALAALGDERIAVNKKELRLESKRYYAGIKLNEDGLRYHGIAVDSDLFKGKTTSATPKDGLINRPIPASWDGKNSVYAMRLAHNKRRAPPMTHVPF